VIKCVSDLRQVGGCDFEFVPDSVVFLVFHFINLCCNDGVAFLLIFYLNLFLEV
jgi:hypothetical protein